MQILSATDILSLTVMKIEYRIKAPMAYRICKHKKCEECTNNDPKACVFKDGDKDHHQSDPKTRFFVSPKFFEFMRLNKSKRGIHQDCCNDNHGDVSKERYCNNRNNGSSERSNSRRYLVCRACFNICASANKHTRCRKTTKDTRTDIRKTQTQEFFRWRRLRLSESISDARRNKRLKDSNKRNDSRNLKDPDHIIKAGQNGRNLMPRHRSHK